ncbi:MAG: prolipoprotein diacylglyceryl transferase [Dethiobacteria bacterium]
MNPDIFVFGGIRFAPYPTMMTIALIIGITGAVRDLIKLEGFTLRRAVEVSLIVPALGLVGARLLYIIQNWEIVYLAPELVFLPRFAGMAYYGSLIAGALTNIVWCRWRKINSMIVADIMVPYFLLGYSLVRIGCFFSGCCYGKVSDVPWAVVMTTAGDLPRHPVQLYASALAFLGFILLLRLYRVRPFVGFVTLSMFAYYGLLRFTTEFFREKDAYILWAWLTEAQVFSLLLVLFSSLLIVIFYKREKTAKGRGFSG